MKRKIKRATVIMVIALLALSLSSCETYKNFKEGFFDEKKETIKVAVYEPETGEDASAGKEETKGIELANSIKPKALDKKIELVYADTGSDLDKAETGVKALMKKNPSVVLGSYGSIYSMLGGEYFQKEEVPAISITNTNPLVTKGNPYYFRICFSHAYQGTALAGFVAEELNSEKVAIMMPKEDDEAMSISTAFEEELTARGKEIIVAREEYTVGETTYARKLSSIKNAKAKIVFLPGSVTDSLTIIKEAKELDLDFVFLGTNIWSDKNFIEKVEESKIYFTGIFETTGEKQEKEFVKAYKKMYGEEPTEGAALGYDSYMLAIDAIEKAKSIDGKKIKEALLAEKDFSGVTGKIHSFSKDGDPQRSVIIEEVKKAKNLPVYTVEPKGEKKDGSKN